MSSNERAIKGPGRPAGSGNRGRSVYHGKCDVRLSAEENIMLDRLAERNEVSRSDIIRKALRDFYKFNSEE